MDYNQLLEKLRHDLPQSHPLLPEGYALWVILFLLFVAFWWAFHALWSVYRVWAAHKRGAADLAQAQNEQQIQVAQAQGRLKAAELNKEAEIIDASAVAKSVEIIGTALHNNAGYLQWKWIHMMEERDSGDTIYVPTEAGLPILEAGKRTQRILGESE